MKVVFSRTTRYFATLAKKAATESKRPANPPPKRPNLPKYYAGACVEKGPSYYDYEHFNLTFGYPLLILSHS